jgi:hypothetical protein
MSVELLRSLRDGRTYARFVIEGHWDDREVSVVGPFNDWTPGIDVLRPDRNGTRSALVAVAEDVDLEFRYLGTGNDWFDDPDADEFGERGSTVHRTGAPAAAKKAPVAKKAPPDKKAGAEPAKKTAAKKSPAPKKTAGG